MEMIQFCLVWFKVKECLRYIYLFHWHKILVNHRILKPWPNGLASWCKSMQVCKNRTCVRTCEGWPNGFASWLASHKISRISLVNVFLFNRLLAINLCRLALGGQTVKKLASTCVHIWAWPKSTQVDASGWPNKTQVEGAKLASTCESVWPGLYSESHCTLNTCEELRTLRSTLLKVFPTVKFARFIFSLTWNSSTWNLSWQFSGPNSVD